MKKPIYPNYIKLYRERKGLTRSQLSKLINRAPGHFAKVEDGEQQITPIWANAIAKHLEVSPEKLIYGEQGAQEKALFTDEAAKYCGVVQAGLWHEINSFNEDNISLEDENLNIMPRVRGEYEEFEQHYFKIKGDSMNLAGMPNGAEIICVKFIDLMREPQDGEFVIVQRREFDKYEITVKQYEKTAKGCILHPYSNNPRWKPMVIENNIDDIYQTDIETKIMSLVIKIITEPKIFLSAKK